MVSHQGLQLKCALVLGVINALVVPAPERFEPQLRELAATTMRDRCVVALSRRAAQLLERSMLCQLSSVVAAALATGKANTGKATSGGVARRTSLPASSRASSVSAPLGGGSSSPQKMHGAAMSGAISRRSLELSDGVGAQGSGSLAEGGGTAPERALARSISQLESAVVSQALLEERCAALPAGFSCFYFAHVALMVCC